jgi:hypothetical protein
MSVSMKSVSIALFAGIAGCAFAHPVTAAEAATFKEKVLYSFCTQAHCTDGAMPAVTPCLDYVTGGCGD